VRVIDLRQNQLMPARLGERSHDGAGHLLDHHDLNWSQVACVRFSLRQRLRYDYASPVSRLRHRLMVLPRAEHGDQHLVSSSLDVTGAEVAVAG
jgi:hypothetical protein